MRLDAAEAKPHVLMTADAVGGVWTYALDLIRGLTAAGLRTTLAVAGPPPSGPQRQAAQDVGATLVTIDAPLDWTAADESELAQAARRLSVCAAELQPDVVHLNSPALAAHAAFDAPVVGVCHSCLATWWAAVKGGTPPEDFAWRIRATAAGYAGCTALVAPSEAFAEATGRAYGIPRPTVIANGSGCLAMPATKERLVLTAGRLWDEGKDVRTLDGAAAHLGARFVALGPTQAPDGTTIRCVSLDLLGAVEPREVARWMGRAAVYASAALYEPFGLAVLEAAEAGAALVLSDIPTFRELWDGAALFVQPRDAAGFAAAISGLLASPERRRDASERSRRRARRYPIQATLDGYLALYAGLTSSRALSAGAAS